MNYDVNVKVKKLIAKCWAEQMCIEGMTDGWVGVNSADGRGETVPYVGAGHWEGGLSWLHSADEGTVSWLTSYGSWHAYEKKKKTEKAKNWVLKFRYPNFVLLNRMRDGIRISADIQMSFSIPSEYILISRCGQLFLIVTENKIIDCCRQKQMMKWSRDWQWRRQLYLGTGFY